MNFPSTHIPFAMLADMAEGRLPAEAQTGLHAHLATCPRCAADLAWLERAITSMRSDDSADAPPEMIARAVRLLRMPASPGLRERVLAVLRFDSLQLPRAIGVRAGSPTERQLLFNAGAHDFDVRLSPVGEAWRISGQVLGPEATGQVELQGGAGDVQAVLDHLGMFILPVVPGGSYTLTVHLPQAEVEIPGLEVGT